MSARQTRRPARRPVHVEARDLDRSPFIYTLPDENGTGYTARRWGQPGIVGRGPEEIDAVQDLVEQEERAKRGFTG